jgi:hypothetical protein
MTNAPPEPVAAPPPLLVIVPKWIDTAVGVGPDGVHVILIMRNEIANVPFQMDIAGAETLIETIQTKLDEAKQLVGGAPGPVPGLLLPGG